MIDATSPTPAEHTARADLAKLSFDACLAVDRIRQLGQNHRVLEIESAAESLLSYDGALEVLDCAVKAAVNERANLLERVRRLEEALRGLLTYDRVERPAFRSMPMGAPNSTVRIAQDKLIALEDAALSALQPEQETA